MYLKLYLFFAGVVSYTHSRTHTRTFFLLRSSAKTICESRLRFLTPIFFSLSHSYISFYAIGET